MGAKQTLLIDDFGDAVQSLPELSGVGSFAEGGGTLNFTIPAGQNGDWWTFGRYSRAAVAALPARVDELYSRIEAEATFTAFSGSVNSELYFNLYKGDVDWYQFMINSGATHLYARRMIGAGATTYAGVALPAYPFRVRMLWNVLAKTIEWYYDDLLGGGWTLLQAAVGIGSFVPTHVLFGGKNWSTFPLTTGSWDDLLVVGEDFRVAGKRGREETNVAEMADAAPYELGGQLDAGTAASAKDSLELRGNRLSPASAAGFDDALLEVILRAKEDALLGRFKGQSGSAEDEVAYRLGALAQYNAYTPTLDGEGHPHLTVAAPIRGAVCRVLDFRRGRWANPTWYSDFTGYAKDGKRYTGGIQDAGPVYAPWYTEAPSNDRSSRGDAPDLVLAMCAWASTSSWELVLYDLDGFPTTLDVWMRFYPRTSWSMVGNLSTYIRGVDFYDGKLAVQLKEGTRGLLSLMDFVSDGRDVMHLIGSDDHWLALAGKTLVNRNDDGGIWNTTLDGRPELRLQNEDPSDVRAAGGVDEIAGDGIATSHFVVCGEDAIDVIEVDSVSRVPSLDYYHEPVGNAANLSDWPYRAVEVGPDGWLWHSVDQYVIRNVFDFRGGVMVDPRSIDWGNLSKKLRRRFRYVELPYKVRSLAATRNWLFAETEAGIYRIDKVTLDWFLCYTIVGGGGGGRLNSPPAGEIILGSGAVNRHIHAMTARYSSYLIVATSGFDGGVTVIRLHDDVVVHSRTADTGLLETGATVAVGYF